ncbi:MAG: hypothetical protein Q4G52_05420 [Clostridia bacterium]|nr:hypothetical protein [Clostridia bacterium]
MRLNGMFAGSPGQNEKRALCLGALGSLRAQSQHLVSAALLQNDRQSGIISPYRLDFYEYRAEKKEERSIG